MWHLCSPILIGKCKHMCGHHLSSVRKETSGVLSKKILTHLNMALRRGCSPLILFVRLSWNGGLLQRALLIRSVAKSAAGEKPLFFPARRRCVDCPHPRQKACWLNLMLLKHPSSENLLGATGASSTFRWGMYLLSNFVLSQSSLVRRLFIFKLMRTSSLHASSAAGLRSGERRGLFQLG